MFAEILVGVHTDLFSVFTLDVKCALHRVLLSVETAAQNSA